MQKSFWSNWFKPASGSSRKWTLEELRELYDVLLRNGVVTEHNRAVVVETIRTIAEYILWGDQNEPRIFDFFLENNLLIYLHKVLQQQPSNRAGEVAKQVLQTLSIIIQNVRSETGIFFLFSNNHINNIIDLDYDFSDEEVLGHYISLLKTISLKLNAGTVHFFLNSGSSTGRSFPLYTRAIRLAHNREGMVRAAVRTLTLNVFSVPDAEIQGFVTSPPAAGYFTEVAQYLAEQVQLLDRHLAAAECGGSSSQSLGSLDSQLAETEDVLSYVADLLSLGVPSISQLLAESFWQWVVRPLLLTPLMQPQQPASPAAPAAAAAAAINSINSSGSSSGLHHTRSGPAGGGSGGSVLGSPVAGAAAGGIGSSNSRGHMRHWSWGSGSWTADASKQSAGAAARVRPVCSVFVLERVFLLVSYQPLLQQLLLALTCDININTPQAAVVDNSSSSSRDATAPAASATSHPLADSSSGSSKQGVSGGSSSSGSGAAISSSCRRSLLGMLSSGHPLHALLALRLLVAVVNSRHLPAELLSGLSLLPRKHSQQQQQQIGGEGGSSSSNSLDALMQLSLQQLQTAGAPASASAGADVLLLLLLTEQYLPRQQVSSSSSSQPAAAAAEDGSNGSGSNSMQQLDQWVTAAAAAAAAAAGGGNSPQQEQAAFASFGPQLLSCLLPLLQLPSLPPLGLWLLGWLLHQLLPPAAVIGATATNSTAAAAASEAAADHQQQGVGGGDGGALVAGSDLQQLDSVGGISRSSSSDGGGGGGGGSSSDSSSSSGRGRGRDSESRHRRNSSIGGAADVAGSSGPPLSTTRAVSVQSSLGFEPRASVLNPNQQQQLEDALRAAHAAFAQQLHSMWCEAVFPLLALEWPGARDVLLRPVLRASSSDLLSGTAVWPILRHLQQQQQQQQVATRQQQHQGGGRGGGGGGGSWAVEGQSVSAQAALECYWAVQRVVALTQVQELLRVGYVATSPPVPTVSESDLKQVDIQEGYQVDLAPGAALPCVVSFAPGQERRVYFAVAGLSKQQMAALQGGSGSNSNSGGGGRPDGSSSGAASGGSGAPSSSMGHGSLLRSLPVAVLADPSPNRPGAGVVLSVAPLLGARPYTDAQVGKWLHVHVRPSVRGLLRVIKTASGKKGGLLSAMRQLADGHWVLAFSSASQSGLAVTMVQQHAGRLRGLYGEALAPLCGQHSAEEQQQQPQPQPQQKEQQQAESPPPQQQQQEGVQRQPEQQQAGDQQLLQQPQASNSDTNPPEASSSQRQQQQTAPHRAAAATTTTRGPEESGQVLEVQQLAQDMSHTDLSTGTNSQDGRQHFEQLTDSNADRRS